MGKEVIKILPRQIITHDGLFHADEVFAIALIHEILGVCPVERTRKVSAESLANPEIWVLDQYGKHEPELNNYDHHQDKSIESTNVLVLSALLDSGNISIAMYDMLIDTFTAISAIDRFGYNQEGYGGFQVNYFFKTLNNIEGQFDTAVLMARAYIRCELESIKRTKESVELWDNPISITKWGRICAKFPIFWKSYKDARYLLVEEKGDWKLHSANSTRWPIAEGFNEVFLHTNKFIAIYKSKADAINAAENSYLKAL